MIKSMTGYGSGAFSDDCWTAEVELSCVNRKQFDCNLSLPRELLFAEASIREAVHRAIARGSVKGQVYLRSAGPEEAVDAAAFAPQLASLREAAAKLGLEDDLKASHLFLFPEWLNRTSLPKKCESAVPVVLGALEEALAGLETMRMREGAALCEDLKTRLGQLRALRDAISVRAEGVATRYGEAMKRRLGDWAAAPEGVEAGMIAREIALFADRCDISEELTRISSHIEQFLLLLSGDGAIGKKLDFLCQELMREFNTTGSKANDAEIANSVIEGKALLETIREQVQNIE